MGQIEASDISPGETVTVPAEQNMIEEMLAFIYVTHGGQKMEQARKHFENQSPSQIRVIYKIFLQQLEQAKIERQNIARYQQQMVYNQAVLNKNRLTAYRDHLKREYDAKIAQKKMEVEVMHRGTILAQTMANRAIVNRAMWGYHGYGGYGYGRNYSTNANGRYPNGRRHYGVSVNVH